MDEISQAQANCTFENIEGHYNVSPETPAFEKEEFEMAEPFLMQHMVVASHYLCFRTWLTPAIYDNGCFEHFFKMDGEPLSSTAALYWQHLHCARGKVNVVRRGTLRPEAQSTEGIENGDMGGKTLHSNI